MKILAKLPENFRPFIETLKSDERIEITEIEEMSEDYLYSFIEEHLGSTEYCVHGENDRIVEYLVKKTEESLWEKRNGFFVHVKEPQAVSFKKGEQEYVRFFALLERGVYSENKKESTEEYIDSLWLIDEDEIYQEGDEGKQPKSIWDL